MLIPNSNLDIEYKLINHIGHFDRVNNKDNMKDSYNQEVHCMFNKFHNTEHKYE